MKKQIEINVPTDYSAITLRQYLKLQRDLKNHEDDVEAQNAYLLYNLTAITPDVALELDSETLLSIQNDLYTMLNKTEYEIQRFIKFEDKEYGFEPNLSKMAYGAYLDISAHKSIEINEDWCNVLNILYRPVTKKRGALYEIEKYKGTEPWEDEKWLDVGMDFHFGVFFYLVDLYKDLVTATLNSMKNHPEMSPNIKSILEKSGELIQQLHNSQTRTSQNLMK